MSSAQLMPDQWSSVSTQPKGGSKHKLTRTYAIHSQANSMQIKKSDTCITSSVFNIEGRHKFKPRLNGCSLAHKLHGNVSLFREKQLRLRTNVSV